MSFIRDLLTANPFLVGEEMYPSNSRPVSTSGSSSPAFVAPGEMSNNLSKGCARGARRFDIGVGGDCFIKSGADCIRLAKVGLEGVGSSGISVRLAADDDRQSALIESGEAVDVSPVVSYPKAWRAVRMRLADVRAVSQLDVKHNGAPSVQDRSLTSNIFCNLGHRSS